MSDWRASITDALAAFETVTQLANMPMCREEFELELLEAPHKPPSSLPSGKVAIYGFWGDGEWLKIGMVGAKSQARYTSQHYSIGGAPSTLVASLFNDPHMRDVVDFNIESPGDWIRSSCSRVNILISAQHSRQMLALLEAFLHVRLRPRYER